MVKIKINLILFCIIASSISSNISFCHTITDSTGRANQGSSGFKTGTVSVIKTVKWIFPVISLIGGGAYFYFDKKADDNYNDYMNASSRELAVDYRTKTKNNDQFANISGITAIASAVISVIAWIFDDSQKIETGEDYKFTLTYGRQLNGYIIREDFDSYLIQTKEGAVNIKRIDIARIEKDGLVIYEK
jgi:hypothetical protein